MWRRSISHVSQSQDGPEWGFLNPADPRVRFWRLEVPISIQRTCLDVVYLHLARDRTKRNPALRPSPTLDLVEESSVHGEPLLQLTLVGQAIKARLLQ
ncbi:hypothetical protein LPJGGPFB_04784 [Ensifer adhaerens]|nr:hypothetical protein [Ensifer adhaerens]